MAADDLGGAPQASQGTRDRTPISSTKTFVPPTSATPGDGILVGLFRSVSAVMPSGG